MAVDLKNHPGRNPDYDAEMKYRLAVRAENDVAKQMGWPVMKMPPMPNKYIPHIGAKQRAKAGVK